MKSQFNKYTKYVPVKLAFGSISEVSTSSR